MKNEWNTHYISSQNIDKISRGKAKVVKKYLLQFQQLIPPKIKLLREGLAKEDRHAVRQILHNISPQLQFFDVPDVVPSIKQIASSYQSMPWSDIEEMGEEIMNILENAAREVDQVLRTRF